MRAAGARVNNHRLRTAGGRPAAGSDVYDVLCVLKIDVFAYMYPGGETHVFSGEARQRSSSARRKSRRVVGRSGRQLPLSVPSPLSFPQPTRPCFVGAPKPPAAVSSDRRRCLLGLLGLLQFFLSTLTANSKILGEACSAEFSRRSSAPAEKPNMAIAASAPAEAGDR